MSFARFAALALALMGLTATAEDPWSKAELLQPAELAASMTSGKKPLIISVAFPVLYRSRHIAGAVDGGATSKSLDTLRKLVADQPKDSEIVVYCGCCPMDKCPNVRPAFAALKEMGFKNVRVLHLPTNTPTDWYAKGYPSENGPVGGGK